MTVEVALVVSIVSVAFSIFFGLKNNKRSDTKEISDRIAHDTKVDMKLDEICNNVRDVKDTLRSIQNDVRDHADRIVRLEASYAALHKRLDGIVAEASEHE